MPEKSGKFDTGLIRELAAILREADLGEIEVGQGDWKVRVTRPSTQSVTYAAPTYAGPVMSPSAAPAAAPAAAAGGDAHAGHPGVVKSPMVGTVYLAPDKEAPPFIRVGDAVTEGQTLLLVEAMKTYNPVPAPRSGRVKEMFVANEQPVEFGEPLVVIE
ncbi:acetyl-CoA carboxylase biotin carboxyl carrier protein [bacterium]|nr:acetyl-CoA carboxylase biotin carboxyl carrier protein [bacterium]